MQRGGMGAAGARGVRQRTSVLVNLAMVVEQANEQVLPAVYLFVGKSLNASPVQLGTLTLCRAMVQTLASPLSGILGDRYDRIMVLSTGAFIWGVMTSAMALTVTLQQAMLFAALNGLGLALLVPCCQSLTADLYPPEQRGRAFGVLQLTASLGGMMGGVFATNLGGTRPWGMDGWRAAFHAIAALSLAVGGLALMLAVDPRRLRGGLLPSIDVTSSLLGGEEPSPMGTTTTTTTAHSSHSCSPAAAAEHGDAGLSSSVSAGAAHTTQLDRRRSSAQLLRLPGPAVGAQQQNLELHTSSGSNGSSSSSSTGAAAGGKAAGRRHHAHSSSWHAADDTLSAADNAPGAGSDTSSNNSSSSHVSSGGSRTALLYRPHHTAVVGGGSTGRSHGAGEQLLLAPPPGGLQDDRALSHQHFQQHKQQQQQQGPSFPQLHTTLQQRAAAGAASSPLKDRHRRHQAGSALLQHHQQHQQQYGPHAQDLLHGGLGGGPHASGSSPLKRGSSDDDSGRGKGRFRRRGVVADVCWMLRIKTFQAIVLQGIVGCFPWQAMVFFTLWLQLTGFSNSTASLLVATFGAGVALGSLAGGSVGDLMAARLPNNGRIFTAQFSVLSGIPLTWLLLKGLPASPWAHHAGGFGAVMFVMGFMCTWAGAGCNSPIFAEIVPDELRSTIYAFDRSFENSIAACAAPVVGLLAEKAFGFSGVLSDEVLADEALRRRNADALGSSLLACMTVPWALCLLAYSALHWFYPRDKALARTWATPGGHGATSSALC